MGPNFNLPGSKRLHITTTQLTLTFLVMDFIVLSILVGLFVAYIQVTTTANNELLDLTNAIHKSDIVSANQTDSLINRTIVAANRNYDTLVGTTGNITHAIIRNQELIKANQALIKNITATNLANTFVNKKNIQALLDQNVQFFKFTDAQNKYKNYIVNQTLPQINRNVSHIEEELDIIKAMIRANNNTR